MSIHVSTMDDLTIWIADDPAKFILEPNVPFPGWLKITTEDGKLLWFNSAHVSAIGEHVAIIQEHY